MFSEKIEMRASKRLAFVLAIILVLEVMPFGVFATSNPAITEQLDYIVENEADDFATFNGGNTCYGFAMHVIYCLFGKDDATSKYRKWKYNGDNKYGTERVASTTDYSFFGMKAALNSARSGDVIQFDTGVQYAQHTMVVYSVDESTVTVVEHNSKIRKKKYSYDHWAGRDYPVMSLIRSDNYEKKYPTHTHHYSVFLHHQAEHPHYAVYQCDACSATQVSTETHFIANCPACASTTFGGTCGEHVSWSYSQTTQTLVLSGYGKMDTYAGHSFVPWSDCPVKTVHIRGAVEIEPNKAFDFGTVEQFITDDDSIYTSIDGVLFSNGGKTLLAYPRGSTRVSYAVPAGTTEIAAYAFYNTTLLRTLTLPNSICHIESDAICCFNDNQLTEIFLDDDTAPVAVQSGKGIEAYAIHGQHLKTISIPRGITSIDDSAFFDGGGYNASLERFIVSAHSETFAAVDGVLYNKEVTELIFYPSHKQQTSFTLPDSVTHIRSGASFPTNRILRQLNVNNIQIGSYLNKYGVLFRYLYALESFSVSETNPTFYCTDGVLFYKRESANTGTIHYLAAYPMARRTETYSIPDGTMCLDHFAFANNPFVQKIIIPTSVQYMGSSTFTGASALTDFIVADDNPVYSADAYGVLYQNKRFRELYRYPEGKTQDTYTILPNTQVIGDDAFYGNTHIKSIHHADADQLLEIRNSAFWGCTSLSYVELGANLESIGGGAFISTAIYRDNTNWHKDTLYYDDCLLDCMSAQEHIEIEPGTRLIADWAFRGASLLKSVSIPDSVKAIGAAAFQYTPMYNDQTNWENGALYIDNCLIEMRSKVSRVVEIRPGTRLVADSAVEPLSSPSKDIIIRIPHGVTNIGSGAISVDMRSVESVFILVPKSVERIGDEAFKGYYESLYSASTLYYAGSANDWLKVKKDYVGVRHLIYGNEATVKTFGDFDYQVNADGTVTIVGYRGSAGAQSAQKAELPPYIENKPVVHIAPFAFSDVKLKGEANLKLIEVTLPDTLETIGEGAFRGMPELQRVNIPPSVRSIGAFAFEDCVNLTDVLHDAFRDLQQFVSAQADGSSRLLSIGERAFRGCIRLRQAFVPDSVLSISASAFQDCAGIQSVYVGLGVTIIGQNAFKGCDGVTKVVYGVSAADAQSIRINAGNEVLLKENVIYMDKKATYTIQMASSLSLQYNTNDTLQAVVQLNGADTNGAIVWQTSNSKVATVDELGKVTAVGKGQATITASYTTPDGSTVTAECAVKVHYAWWQWLIIIFLLGWIWY